MTYHRLFPLAAVACLAMALLFTTGCQGQAGSAQKLFDQGKYEQVIKQYPDLEIARRARVKMADKLLQDKQYSIVLKDYADTRAAYQARLDMADNLMKQGKYQAVLDSFPGSPAASMAKEKLADSLFKAGNFDELISRFGDTPQGTQVKEQQSVLALEKAKQLKGEAKKQALQGIMQKYAGTTAYKEAAGMLSDINTKEAAKKK